MSLDYVNKGEFVKATTINSIIDAIGGNQSMSPDLNVTTTTRGPKVSIPYKFGGPNSPTRHILDQSRYMLSGWPMASLNLGAKMGDCLDAIKYHRLDGGVDSSLCAAIVYKNSGNSPTGSALSGYMLSASDFGIDKAVGAAGWVNTMIEDPHPGGVIQAQLWKWDDGQKLATVFTNVKDETSVLKQLSGLMTDAGADTDEVSSLVLVDGWDLSRSHMLSVNVGGQTKNIPTHDLVFNNGQIDYYEQGSAQDYDVVLKADLVCLSVELNEEDEIVSTKWAWKIPLGDGTTSEDGKVFSTNLTYGGNKIVIEADEGDPGSGEGDTFSGGAIWHGGFVASAGDEISAGSLWLNLSWDYNDKCVKGAFSDHQASGGFSQDGILSRNIFVARAGGFTPTNSTKEMDSAPRETIHHGTWGDLPVDGPKMDSYCDHESGVKFQSIEWDDLGGETTECQVQQIHEFSDLDNVVDVEEEDHIMVRREDDNGGAEVVYVNLSSILSGVMSAITSAEVPTDTDSPNSNLSSVQWTLDNNNDPCLQVFKFDNHQVEDADFAHDEVLVKRQNNIEYVSLSSATVSGDTNNEIGCSIVTNDGLNGTKYHQLYKFDQSGLSSAFEPDVQVNGSRQNLLPDEYEFVLRKNGPNGEIAYGTVELSAYGAELSADSDVGAQKSIDIDNSVIQLHDMDENGSEVSALVPHCFDEAQNPLSSLDAEFVVRKGGAGGEIGYVSLELLQDKTPLDRNTYHTQKSLQYATIDNLSFLELNGFHAPGTTLPKVTLTSAYTTLLPNSAEFLYRTMDSDGYWQLNYAPLSVNLSVDAMASLSVDTDVVGTQRSIEWVEDQQDGNYIQLYKMDEPGQEHTTTIRQAGIGYHLLPDDYEFVVRSQQGGQIDYMDVSLCCLLSGAGGPPISGDTQVTQNLSSLELVQPNNANPYYQLHDFHTTVKNGPNTTIRFGDAPEAGPDFSIGCNTQFVVRKPMPGGGYEIQYTTLSATQQHEPVDSGQGPSINGNAGWSLDYASYPGCNGCYQALELLNFNSGCTEHITSATISAQAGNGILIRKWNDGGCAWNLEYMDFDSLDELAKKYIGDSQLSQPPHNPYNYGLSVFWDDYDKKYAIELYNWTTDFSTKGVTIHNDGCTYYWPQNAKVDGYSGDLDYILVKHVDTNGNAELKYKQLEVTMPNIDVSQIEGDIQNIYGDINEFYDEISYLSGCIDDLSGQLSGDYWESGGHTDTCYGAAIGNSNGDLVIDLDGHTFYDPTNSQYGWWFSCRFGGNDFQVEGTSKLNDIVVGHLGGDISFWNGCTYISESGSYFNGSVEVGCDLQAGNSIRIGCTSLTESQLTALLQLI